MELMQTAGQPQRWAGNAGQWFSRVDPCPPHQKMRLMDYCLGPRPAGKWAGNFGNILNLNMKQPSDFKTFPWSSVRQDANDEQIALNIMVILSRTGDQWRTLTWEEYRAEREKDGRFSTWEKPHFDAVIDYTTSPETAALFCLAWRQIAKEI